MWSRRGPPGPVPPPSSVTEALKILFLNQAFYPDVVASGQVLTDVALDMTRAGHHVTVMTAASGYDDTQRRFPSRQTWNGVEIRRLGRIRLGKGSRWRRAVDFGSFLTVCALRLAMANQGGYDVVVAMTSPPLVSVLAALFARLRGGRLIVWMLDLNPDEAIAAGWLKAGSLAARILQGLLTFSLRRAATIVVLDRFMRDRVLARGIDPAKVIIIPPWSHDNHVAYDVEGRARFRQQHGLADKVVVMYAGNHSPCHPLDTLLEAARQLRGCDRIRFVFVGGGSEAKTVRRFVEVHGLRNVLRLPYQPLAELSAVLSAADSHVVTLGDAFVGIVHPCKIYNILRVGGPVLYIGPRESHVADLAAWLPPGTIDAFTHGDVTGVARRIFKQCLHLPLERALARELPNRCHEFSKSVVLPRLVGVITGTGVPPEIPPVPGPVSRQLA